MPKKGTKTRAASKTTKKILVATIAIATLGLAAYGYSQGFFVLRRQQLMPPPNVVEVSPERGVPYILPRADNEPVLTTGSVSISVPLKSIGPTKNVKLFSFSVSPLQDPQQFGDVTLKQLVYSLKVTRGLKLSKFRLAGFSETATSLTPLSIAAYRATGQKKIFHVGKADTESVISIPEANAADEEFILVVTAKDKEIKFGLQNIIELSADVELAIETVPQAMSVKTSLLTDASSDKIGGYLWNDRKYGDSVASATPADPNIFYLMQSVKPIDNETSNLKPDYLSWCPSIFSDGGAATHKAISGKLGGSDDWFCFTGQQLLGSTVKFTK